MSEKGMKLLAKIQQNLKAPKNQYNNFGRYKYRSCEDILEGVKPLLEDSIIIMNDNVVVVGDRYYFVATATFMHGDFKISATSFAREALQKKGMDESQISGTASSYARKYALNALLLIDDAKDSDANEQKYQTNSTVKKDTKEIKNKFAKPEQVASSSSQNQIKSKYSHIIAKIDNRDWVIPTGSIKGKTLKEIDIEDLRNRQHAIEDWAKKNKLNDIQKSMLAQISAYVFQYDELSVLGDNSK